MRTMIVTMTALALLAVATPVDAHEFQVGDYYVTPHPGHVAEGHLDYEVWEETNGLRGLQKVGFTDDSGRYWPADERVA